MNRFAGPRWSAWLFGMCAGSLAQSQTTVGRTQGEASVSPTGAAQYAAPLVLPPGTNGLAPGLAIVYDHRGGNGLLGVGFRLSGFSAIRRCGSTIAQDGTPSAIGLDAADRLCLDGQRLRLTSGVYGQPGSQYQTEVETFSRVSAYGAAGSGPAWFQVERRDGLIYQYGATTDSRIESLGNAAPREWALNRVRDRSGNFVDFVYTEDTATGSYRPARVDYTGNVNVGSAPYYSVRFTYESRPAGDQPAGYIAGGLVQETYRLARIDAQHTSGTVLRSYVLSYDATSPSARSRLSRIQECAAASCLQSTNFTWGNSSPGWSAEAAASVAAAALSTAIAGDLNGDGYEDLAYLEPGNVSWRILHGGSSGLATAPFDTGLGEGGLAAQALSADLDGNGRRDIVVPGAGNAWYWLRSSTGTAYAYSSTGVTNVASAGNTTLIDVDGDARDDFVYARDTANAIVWRRNLTAGGVPSFAPEATLWTAPAGTRLAAAPFGTSKQRFRSAVRGADFNGDGRGDLLLRVQTDGCGGVSGCTPYWSDRWQAFASRGSSLVPQFTLEPAPDPLLADFNGDGLTDIAFSPNGYYWRLFVGTGRRGTTDSGVMGLLTSAVPGQNADGRAMVTDWDGDGRTDLLVPGSGEWQVCRSFGTSLESCRATGMSSANLSGSPIVLDADGDGLADLLQATTSAALRLHGPGVPDLLGAVVDGFGARVEFAYAPLSRPDVHVSARNAIYPVKDLTLPDTVVSRVTRSDGVGGTFTESYVYEGAKVDALGRGYLGFARRRVTDSRTGLVTVEDRAQDPVAYDRVGALSSVSVQQPSGTMISRVSFAWASLPFGAGFQVRGFPYVYSSSTDRFELDGTLVSTTYVTNRVDSFGTLISRTSTTTEAGGLNPGATHIERLTVGTVINDTSGWCLGRAGSMQVARSHTLPGGAQVTRSFSRTVDPAMCRTTQQVVEPGSAELRVASDLGYDSFGNLVMQTDSASGQAARTTRFEWSGNGRFLAARINAEGQRTTTSWDAVQALPASMTDRNGLVTQRQYDAFRRLSREIRADGTRTEYTRGACAANCLAPTAVHFVTASEQASGGLPIRSSTVGFDLYDREVYAQSEQPGGSVMTVSRYSNRGLLAQQSAPSFCCSTPSHWQSYSYDLLGRPTWVERPAGGADPTPVVTHWQYAGLTTSLTDALGRATVTRRDARGNVVQSIDPGNADTDFEYDAFGNLLKARDFRGNETSMSYDLRGRRTSVNDVDSGLRTLRYTPYGDLRSETNARGQTVTIAYDRLSRRISRQEPEGTTSWTWGTSAAARNVGSLVSVSGPGVQESFEYDALGRLSGRTLAAFGATFTTRFGYDAATGLLDVITYPSVSGSPLRIRQHHDRGRVVRVTDADDVSTTYWQLGAVDPLGQVAYETLGNGVQVASSFDPVTGLLVSRTAGPGGGSSYQDLRYSWDPAGNLSARQEGNLGVYEQFAYDNRDRLDRMQSTNGATVDLDYDEIGNVTYKSDVGPYTYHPTRKHAVVAAGSNTYSYDANGDVVNANGTTIFWTSYDLPARIMHPGGNYSLFDYGPDRSRIRQMARGGSEISETVYAGGGLYERVSRNGVISQRHYIVVDGRRVAVHTRASGATPTTVYLLEDHLGGVDGLTSSSGGLLARASNQPFGARRAGDWTASAPTSGEWQQLQSTTPRGFTDHEHVDNLGVIHMNGRVYDPVLGRFLSPDPIVQSPHDAQSWNRYSYVRNNPLRYTDPSGFACFNGYPAIDRVTNACFRRVMESVIVQASRINDSLQTGFINVSRGFSSSGLEASGSVSGADAANTVGTTPVEPPPVPAVPTEEIVVTGVSVSSLIPIPLDIGFAVAANFASISLLDSVLETTTGLGEEAAEFYADKQVETGNPLYSVPGTLASLWTPDTAPETIVVLGAAGGLGRWSARPYWQYLPENNPGYSSTWLTRGSGWEPPFQPGQQAAEGLALPSYNPGTVVRAVDPPWYQYVRGPRVVAPQPAFGPRAIGGGREYRVVPFEQ